MPDLCPKCKSIDLPTYSSQRRFFTVNLGTWTDIKAKEWCAFCSLVVDAIVSQTENPVFKSTIRLTNRKAWLCCVSYSEYDGGRRIAYSNKCDLEEQFKRVYNGPFGSGSSYHYVLYWDGANNSRQEVFIRPMLDSRPFFGRSVNPDRVNPELIQFWLQLCEAYHGQACDGHLASRSTLPQGFRLIDIKNNRIVAIDYGSKVRYAALSYVWGMSKMSTDMPLSFKQHIRIDKSGREEIPLPDPLPKTLRDAITVATLAGYSFLWIDALCIIQNDDQERKSQIYRMDAIFNNASLTIAAGSSIHADWGLPGISRKRSVQQRTIDISGTQFAVPFPTYRWLSRGMELVWNTRGWTFQEKIMSPRLLLFTDYQMYFRCGNSIFAEDVAMETGKISESIMRRENPFLWVAHRKQREPPSFLTILGDSLTLGQYNLVDQDWKLTFLPNYVSVVTEYTQRSLSFQEDVFLAISGVLNSLDPSDMAFSGCLPRAWMGQALLWQPRMGTTYTSRHETVMGVPSWSWAAWDLSSGCFWYLTDLIKTRKHPMTIHTKMADEYVHSRVEHVESETLLRRDRTTPRELSESASRLIHLSGVLLAFESPVPNLLIGKRLRGVEADHDTLQLFTLLDKDGTCIGKVWTTTRVAATGLNDFVEISTCLTGIDLDGLVNSKHIPTKEITEKVKKLNKTTNLMEEVEEKKIVDQMATEWEVINVMLVRWKDDVAYCVAIGKVIGTAWPRLNRRVVYLG